MTTKTSFALGFILPNQVSSQRLSTGVYSLSSRSNIPYARLLGKGIDKVFSWGEIVEVPSGQICSVYNASYHAGDLFINGGCDTDNKPARITVPVPFDDGASRIIAGKQYFVPTYPADVRMARRAYLCIDAKVKNLPVGGTTSILVIGIRIDGSHNTENEIQATAVNETGSGYLNGIVVPWATALNNVPLGHCTTLGDDTRPHTLLTTAEPLIENTAVPNGGTANLNAYYTMEY